MTELNYFGSLKSKPLSLQTGSKLKEPSISQLVPDLHLYSV